MSTKKLSDLYLRKEVVIKNIDLLESRLEMIENKIRKTKRETFDKKLAVLEDSKNEIQNRVNIENQKLSLIQQKIKDVEKYGEINPFDFNDIDQDDDEI